MLRQIVKEPLSNPHATSEENLAFLQQLQSAREQVLGLISRNLSDFGEKFPAETCVEGYYPLTENVEWTTSFWTGQLWLAWK